MTMSIIEARAIMHRVLSMRGVESRLGGLLHDRSWYLGQGNVVQAGEVERTIDELAGHRHEGAWIGAAQIAEASALTARQPVQS